MFAVFAVFLEANEPVDSASLEAYICRQNVYERCCASTVQSLVDLRQEVANHG